MVFSLLTRTSQKPVLLSVIYAFTQGASCLLHHIISPAMLPLSRAIVQKWLNRPYSHTLEIASGFIFMGHVPIIPVPIEKFAQFAANWH
jgi:hypothetical protein